MTNFLKKQEKNYSVLSSFFFKKKIDCDRSIIIPLLVIKAVCINISRVQTILYCFEQ